jgi:hypothetical protein
MMTPHEKMHFAEDMRRKEDRDEERCRLAGPLASEMKHMARSASWANLHHAAVWDLLPHLRPEYAGPPTESSTGLWERVKNSAMSMREIEIMVIGG